MTRRRRRLFDNPWFKNLALKLNGVSPSLIHDYGKNRYYNTTNGATAFPFTATRTTNATMFDNAGKLIWAPNQYAAASEDLTSASWAKAAGSGGVPTVTPGFTAPDGSATAWGLDCTDGNGRIANSAISTLTTLGGNVTFSFWARTWPGDPGGTISSRLRRRDGTQGPNQTISITSTWQRFSYTLDCITGTFQILAYAIDAGQPSSLDRMLLWHPMISSGDVVYDYVPNTSVLAAVHCARLDYNPVTLLPRGVLVETSSTNSSPNSGLAGGVAGTPGTAPTGWNISAVTGVTVTTSYGSLDGFPYIDVAYSGTNTSGLAAIPTIRFCPTSSIVAANGETWTTSVHIQQVGGTDSITSHTHGIKSRDSGGTLVSGQAISESLVDAASLKEARHDITFTFSGATVAFVEHTTQRSLAIGASIDITLRIWLPQLEEKEFASSIIPTYGTAATRALDNLTTPVASWLDATKGTIYADFMRRYVAPGAGSSTGFAQIYTDTGNRVVLLCGSGTNSQHRFDVFDATVAQTQQQTSVGNVAMVERRMAGMYILNLFLAAENGASSAGDVLGTVPTMTSLSIGSFGTSGQMDGWVKEFRYYPVGNASNAQLQTLTS